jgi:hypothetical protein
VWSHHFLCPLRVAVAAAAAAAAAVVVVVVVVAAVEFARAICTNHATRDDAAPQTTKP